MGATLRLKVVTPEGSLLDEDVSAVTARSEVGEFCVLPEHRPILASLSAGRFLVEAADGGRTEYVVDAGFFEGGPDHVNVITQNCIARADIDAEQVRAEMSELTEKVSALEEDAPEREELLIKMNWAQARIDSVAE